MRTILIDNEKIFRDGLRNTINLFASELNIVAEADGVKTGLEAIDDFSPELVFLDVEMDDGTGMDLLSKLDEIAFSVIFVTAHDKYAVSAFRFSALDYILKPINVKEFEEAVQKAKEVQATKLLKERLDIFEENTTKSEQTKKLVLSGSKENLIVQISDVLSIEAEGSYSNFSFKNGETQLVSKNLKEYEQLLEEHKFFRAHRSWLINLKEVVKTETKDEMVAILTDDSKVPVSFRNRKQFTDSLKKL
jgi:two-component system LytT family response regulator